MATLNVSRHAYGTLAAGVADTVNFTLDYPTFEVVNRGTSDIYVRADGTAPAVDTDGSDLVLAGTSAMFNNPLHNTRVPLTVKLISASICKYLVSAP